MAYYSTFPFDNLVGPGIGRAEYGGFLMSLPPRRMYDVWQDPEYELAESKSERLLLAAIDYSIYQYVVYVAAKPPRSSSRPSPRAAAAPLSIFRLASFHRCRSRRSG